MPINRLISVESRPAGQSELALFEVPSTEVGIQKSQYLEILPKNTLTNDGPFVFQISPNPQLLQLSKNYLLLEFRILDRTGSPITAKVPDPTPGADAAATVDAPKVAPINLIAKTFI